MGLRRLLATFSLPLATACLACAGLIGIEDPRYGAGADDAATDVMAPAEEAGDAAQPPTRTCDHRPDLLLCDDFEATAIDSSWSQTTTLGSLKLDRSRFKSGKQSLRVHTDATTAADPLAEAAIGKSFTPPKAFFTRVWVWFALPISQGTAAEQIFFNLDGPNSTGLELLVHRQSTAPRLIFNDYATSPTTYVASTAAFPVDRWTCVETQIDEGAHTSRVFVDGVADDSLPQTGLGLSSVTVVSVGLHFGSRTDAPAYDVWVDDYAIGPARIGCD